MPTILTRAACRTWGLDDLDGVATRHQLSVRDIDRHAVTAQLAARRWRRLGTAIVLHNGPITRPQAERITLINCGPRAVHTSFTAVARWGLQGWTRPDIHVLAPAGTTRPRIRGLVLHRTGDWSAVQLAPDRALHLLPQAMLLAAASFATSRPGCGLLAAGVQQRLLSADDLRTALDQAPRLRHRAALLLAVGDIAQGAEALSEIDFRRLCRRYGLPPPRHQAVRVEPSGRRRYLDAEWELPDGRRVAAEIDGAHHLNSTQWIADSLRQNSVVIGGTLVLRYPSIVVRDAPHLVADQLRRLFGARP